MWDETGHRLPDTVAISPQKLAEKSGFEIPADRKTLLCKYTGCAQDDVLSARTSARSTCSPVRS